MTRPEKIAIKKDGVTFRGPFEDLRVPTVVEGESMTDATQGNDTDINNIIARFDRTGVMPTATREGQYADVSGLNRDLTELIQNAQEAVEELQAAQANAESEPEQETTNEPEPAAPQASETTEQ